MQFPRISDLYGKEYLRRPTNTNVKKLYAFHEEKHGFLGMLGSSNCTDWPWAQCPYAYHAQLCMSDHGSDLFILLETIASQDL